MCPLRVTVHVLNQPLLFHVFSLPNAQLIMNAGRQVWALWLADSYGLLLPADCHLTVCLTCGLGSAAFPLRLCLTSTAPASIIHHRCTMAPFRTSQVALCKLTYSY